MDKLVRIDLVIMRLDEIFAAQLGLLTGRFDGSWWGPLRPRKCGDSVAFMQFPILCDRLHRRASAVLLPIADYERLMEDLDDLAVIAERRDEPTEPFSAVKHRLEVKWRATEST